MPKKELTILLIFSLQLIACTITGEKFSAQQEPFAGQALMYIYRNIDSPAQSIDWAVELNGEIISQLRHGEFSYHYIASEQEIELAPDAPFGREKPKPLTLKVDSQSVYFYRLDLELIVKSPCKKPSCKQFHATLKAIEAEKALAELDDYRFSHL